MRRSNIRFLIKKGYEAWVGDNIKNPYGTLLHFASNEGGPTPYIRKIYEGGKGDGRLEGVLIAGGTMLLGFAGYGISKLIEKARDSKSRAKADTPTNHNNGPSGPRIIRKTEVVVHHPENEKDG